MINLAPLHSFAMPYKALDSRCFDSVATLREAAKIEGLFKQPHIILGSGTNTIFSCDFKGTVIKLENKALTVQEDNDYYYLEVDAGYEWHQLVKWTLDNHVYGLENLALIPGTVGAAPIQNIGAYGVEFDQVCDYVEYLDKSNLDIIRVERADLQLAYRDSIFKHALKEQTVISKVGLKIKKQWQAVTGYQGLNGLTNAVDIFDAVVALRQSKLPDHHITPNAGSFFKNPLIDKTQLDSIKRDYLQLPFFSVGENQYKVPAAWLIEQCGLKGKHIGNIAVDSKHALILINKRRGTGTQLLELITLIRSTVLRTFNITLEPEVKIIGSTCALNGDDF